MFTVVKLSKNSFFGPSDQCFSQTTLLNSVQGPSVESLTLIQKRIRFRCLTNSVDFINSSHFSQRIQRKISRKEFLDKRHFGIVPTYSYYLSRRVDSLRSGYMLHITYQYYYPVLEREKSPFFQIHFSQEVPFFFIQVFIHFLILDIYQELTWTQYLSLIFLIWISNPVTQLKEKYRDILVPGFFLQRAEGQARFRVPEYKYC